MPKNIEDIIVPERRRSIRDIPIPEGRKKNVGYGTESNHNDSILYGNKPTSSLSPLIEKKQSRKKVWISIGVAIVLLFIATLSLFNGATLSYVPKSLALMFENDIYTARKSGDGGLLFSVIKLSGDLSLDIPTTGEEDVQRKASGSIIIYNASAKEQKLRATTRFATPEGKTYQVKDAINIPAKKVVGGVEKPGTLEVTVYAEFPGKEYNIGLSDFTLPGLKGTSLYSSIYARSKTVISGGSSGKEKIVSKEDGERAKVELEKALSEKLISEAKAQVPQDFILVPSLSSVSFEDLPQTDSSNKNNVMLNKRGNLQAVMFKKSDLSLHLAQKKITLATGELIDLNGFDSLNFSFVDLNVIDLLQVSEIKFTVNGQALAVWRTDEVALKSSLLGKHKRDINAVLNNFPTVVSATATIKPFWKSSFPTDGSDILVKKLPVK